MRPGANPTRRNRNIGTAKQGHGQNNWLRIADPRHEPSEFWARLGKYAVAHRLCGGRRIPFFVEETRSDCVHACTVDDLAAVLDLIPSGDWRGLAAILLRQPKRKEEILRPVWGRVAFDTDIGRPQDGYAGGHVVILDAHPPDLVWRRGKPMNAPDAEEVDRLVEDGHVFTGCGKRFRVTSSLHAIRATQLYRTVPHEIGHLADLNSRPLDGSSYWRRPAREREEFAHRYADMTRQRLRLAGHIPFPRIESWTSDGLRPSDFDPLSPRALT